MSSLTDDILHGNARELFKTRKNKYIHMQIEKQHESGHGQEKGKRCDAAYI